MSRRSMNLSILPESQVMSASVPTPGALVQPVDQEDREELVVAHESGSDWKTEKFIT
jgi:hypothetical protein